MDVLFRERRYYKDKIWIRRDRINVNFSKYHLLSCDHTLQTLSEKNDIRMETEVDKVAKPIHISREKQRKTVPFPFIFYFSKIKFLRHIFMAELPEGGRISSGNVL